MANWYEENIEEGIRDVVRLLRDNGFNTECSCHHEMTIQCQYIVDGSVQRLHDLLYNYLSERNEEASYRLTMVCEVQKGGPFNAFFNVELLGRAKRTR